MDVRVKFSGDQVTEAVIETDGPQSIVHRFDGRGADDSVDAWRGTTAHDDAHRRWIH